MYVSRSSIVIKTNYEKGRLDGGCRVTSGRSYTRASSKPIWRALFIGAFLDHFRLGQNRPSEEKNRPNLAPRRANSTTPSRDHPSSLRAIYVKSSFSLLKPFISVTIIVAIRQRILYR